MGSGGAHWRRGAGRVHAAPKRSVLEQQHRVDDAPRRGGVLVVGLHLLPQQRRAVEDGHPRVAVRVAPERCEGGGGTGG